MKISLIFTSLISIFLISLLLYKQRGRDNAFSETSGKFNDINILTVFIIIFLQFVIAFFLLKGGSQAKIFEYIGLFFAAIGKAISKGTHFVFGDLADPSRNAGLGFIFIIHALPAIILIGTLSSVLMHLRILPFIINTFSVFISKVTGISKGGSISAGGSIFFGISENAVVLRRYIQLFKSSDVLIIMILGMSTVAPSMIGVYSSMYGDKIPNLMQYICVANILSIVGSLWITMPLRKENDSFDNASFEKSSSLLSAISDGIIIGAKVVVIISALLLGFVAFIEFIDLILKNIIVFGSPVTISRLFGWVFTPIAMLLGADNPQLVGSMIGIKIGINEFIAFNELANIATQLTKSDLILSVFCISNFGNISTVAMVVGVYSSIIEDRKEIVANIAMKAFYISLLNTFFTSSIVMITMHFLLV